MIIQPEFRNRLKSIFAPLSKTASGRLPPIGHLSKELTVALDRSPGTKVEMSVSGEIVKAFATASVEIWLRAVHSFLISCALTKQVRFGRPCQATTPAITRLELLPTL